MDITSPGNAARPISAPASPSVLRANSDLVGGWANWEQLREREAEGRMLHPTDGECGRFHMLRSRNRRTATRWRSD